MLTEPLPLAAPYHSDIVIDGVSLPLSNIELRIAGPRSGKGDTSRFRKSTLRGGMELLRAYYSLPLVEGMPERRSSRPVAASRALPNPLKIASTT